MYFVISHLHLPKGGFPSSFQKSFAKLLIFFQIQPHSRKNNIFLYLMHTKLVVRRGHAICVEIEYWSNMTTSPSYTFTMLPHLNHPRPSTPTCYATPSSCHTLPHIFQSRTSTSISNATEATQPPLPHQYKIRCLT